MRCSPLRVESEALTACMHHEWKIGAAARIACIDVVSFRRMHAPSCEEIVKKVFLMLSILTTSIVIDMPSTLYK